MKMLNEFLISIVNRRVTDVHIDVKQNKCSVVLRRYKLAIDTFQLSSSNLFYSLKNIANFDPTHFGSQTGTFEWVVDGIDVLFRFAAIETYSHTNGVLRILNIHAIQTMQDITSDKEVICVLEKIVNVNSGLVLFVGKTGSGKSTTMFHTLRLLSKQMVYTLENPIERYEPSWIQFETHNIESGITQLLRHDPDIIMIGEVRTKEDITALIRASLSGHKVFTTMHAGSIEQAIRRLMDLEASKYDLMTLLEAIVYQEIERTEEGEVCIQFDIETHPQLKARLQEMQD